MDKATAEGLSNIAAIREFFKDDLRKLEMSELKALTHADREELGVLCRAALAERNKN